MLKYMSLWLEHLTGIYIKFFTHLNSPFILPLHSIHPLTLIITLETKLYVRVCSIRSRSRLQKSPLCRIHPHVEFTPL